MIKEKCLWEIIYLKDDLWKNDTASKRIKLGRLLGQKFSMKNGYSYEDIVVPIPETAILLAQGYSMEKGIPLVYALYKKRPKIRTLFIKNREKVMKDIFFVIPELVKNKSIALIDETTISGASISIAIQLLKEAGAKEIRVRMVAPIKRQCPKEDFIKSWTTISHIPNYAKHLDVDSFGCLSIKTLKEFAECTYCFEGDNDETDKVVRS